MRLRTQMEAALNANETGNAQLNFLLSRHRENHSRPDESILPAGVEKCMGLSLTPPRAITCRSYPAVIEI